MVKSSTENLQSQREKNAQYTLYWYNCGYFTKCSKTDSDCSFNVKSVSKACVTWIHFF